MTELFQYSASQIDTWVDCPRKWGWTYIDRVPRIENASAQWGTRAHALLEAYLRHGTPIDHCSDPDMAARTSTALPYLPDPGTPGLSVEVDWSANFGTGRLYTGRIDYLVECGGVQIGDHKTTSSIEKWSKSEADLLTDVQSILYGKYVLHSRPQLDRVEAQWEYIQSKGAKRCETRNVTLHRSAVEAEFARIDAIAAQIDAWRTRVNTASQLPYNSDSCEKYGGCPFQHLCNLSPEERLGSIMSASTSLFDQLQAGNNAPAAPVAPSNPQAPAPARPPSSGLASLLTRDSQGRVTHALNGKPLPPKAIETQHVRNPQSNGYLPIYGEIDAHTAACMEHAAAEFEKERASTPQAPPQAWTPPGAPVPPAYAPPPAPYALPQPNPINPPESVGNPIPPSPPPAETGAAAPAAPKKRGRPSKAEMEARAAAGAPQAPPVAFQAPQAPVPVATMQINPPAPQAPQPPVHAPGDVDRDGGFAIFIDAHPVQGFGDSEFLDLSDVVAAVRAQVKDATKTPETPNGVDDFSFVQFGKGAGILAHFAEHYIRAKLTESDLVLTVNSQTREASAVLNRLLPLAGTIVRGA